MTRRPAPVALLATLALVFVTLGWGSSFVLLKDMLERVPAVDYLAVRFGIAGVVLLAVAPRAVTSLSPTLLRRGAALGLVYGVAQVLQTVGLDHTSASVSGFVTGMYVVITPLLAALILRSRITALTWTAVLLAAAGLGVLTLDGFAIGYGEGLTLLSAALYALHIVGLGAWSTPREALGLSTVQLLVIAAVCFAGTAPGGVVLPSTGQDWAVMIYLALVVGLLGLLAQTWAQAHLSPTRSAIIMTMEPVFAALFAVLLGGESLGIRMLLGGALVLTAMLVVEVRPRRGAPDIADVPHLPQ
ncbi:MAG TPA: DMT family transporter [Nocardioides sp.]|uniref:DMT family transporter n=1 Tax=Nocardioides sp. TaxID=35761 RepID=UPI002ED895CD